MLGEPSSGGLSDCNGAWRLNSINSAAHSCNPCGQRRVPLFGARILHQTQRGSSRQYTYINVRYCAPPIRRQHGKRSRKSHTLSIFTGGLRFRPVAAIATVGIGCLGINGSLSSILLPCMCVSSCFYTSAPVIHRCKGDARCLAVATRQSLSGDSTVLPAPLGLEAGYCPSRRVPYPALNGASDTKTLVFPALTS